MIVLNQEKSTTTINLDGPEGNAFNLLGIAKEWSSKMGLDKDMVMNWMTEGDYVHLVAVFDHFFGNFCSIVTSNPVLMEQIKEVDLKL